MSVTQSIYRLADGVFTGQTITVPAGELEANTPPGCRLYPGVHDPKRWRVDLASGELLELPPERPADTEHVAWVWDAELGRYVPTMTVEGERVQLLATLNAALKRVDQDSGTDRAVRELLLASNVPEQAKQRMREVEARAADIRALIVRAGQASSLGECEAIAADMLAQQVVQATA